MTIFKNTPLTDAEETLLDEALKQHEAYLYAQILKFEKNLLLFPDDEEDQKQFQILEQKYQAVRQLIDKII